MGTCASIVDVFQIWGWSGMMGKIWGKAVFRRLSVLLPE